MNKELPHSSDTSKAEKEFFGGKTLAEHHARPTIIMPEAPRLTQAEVQAKNAEDHARHMTEAELKVQAWFDAGMKPAERENKLKLDIEDLEREFEEMEPMKDEDKDAFNRRSEAAIDELNAAKAELTVLQRRLVEAKAKPGADNDFVAPGKMSAETTMRFARREPTQNTAPTPAKILELRPTAEEQRHFEARQGLRGFFGAVRQWFTPKPRLVEAPRLTDYDNERGERKSVSMAIKESERDMLRQRAMVEQDKEVRRLREILTKNPNMMPGNRRRYEEQLAAARQTAEMQLREKEQAAK